MTAKSRSLAARSHGVRRSARALLRLDAWCAGALTLAACTDPRYAADADAELLRDAASLSSDRQDAGSTPEAGGNYENSAASESGADASGVNDDASSAPAVPSWAGQLVDLSPFAVQTFYFAEDTGMIVRGVSRLYAEIRAVEGDYEMTAWLCSHDVTSDLSVVHVAHPTALVARHYRVSFTSDSFSADPEPNDTTIGYAASAPPECDGRLGQTVVVDGRSCACTGEVLPPENDCRVNDADGDGYPGYTLIARIKQFNDSSLWGVSESRSKFLNGQSAEDGRFVAQIELHESWLQYECAPACTDLSGTTPACAPEQSSVEFVSLAGRAAPDGSWNCDAVALHAGELFSLGMPADPPTCSR